MIIEPPAVRILPMNRSKEFPECNNVEDLQQQFFLGELPSRPAVDYLVHKGLKAEQGTVILFQSDGNIIASAVLLEYKRFEQHDGDGYEGCLYLDSESIKVFDPVTEHILIRIWPEIKKLGQVKWSLNPKGYVAFEQELLNVRTPTSFGKEFVDIFPVSEDYDDWTTGESIAQGFPPDVNAIPGEPINKCYHTLMVAIGSADNVEARILEAVIHIKLKCPGENKKVIFTAAKWESGSWRKWVNEFRCRRSAYWYLSQ